MVDPWKSAGDGPVVAHQLVIQRRPLGLTRGFYDSDEHFLPVVSTFQWRYCCRPRDDHRAMAPLVVCRRRSLHPMDDGEAKDPDDVEDWAH